MADVNETLVDEFIRHQIYLDRYKDGQLQDLQAFLQELQDDVSSQLGKKLTDVKTAGTVNTKRLQALLRDIQAISDDVAAKMEEAQTNQLRALSLYEQDWTLTVLRATIPVEVKFNQVSPDLLWAAVNDRPFEGRLLSEWFKDYSAAQKQRLTSAVRMSIIEGETVEQTILRIRGTRATKYTDGLIQGITRRSAEALARTSIAHVTQTARQAMYESNDEVISELQWHSTLDSRTSLICASRDGNVYPIDSGPRPPAHPNCRSIIIPVIKSWEDLGLDFGEVPEGTRASMNGQVPESTTYAEWLKRQPASFQDDVLGVTKGKLFRKGDLTLDKFVDERTGRGYTLDQLRQLHPAVF